MGVSRSVSRVWFLAHLQQAWKREVGPVLRKAEKPFLVPHADDVNGDLIPVLLDVRIRLLQLVAAIEQECDWVPTPTLEPPTVVFKETK